MKKTAIVMSLCFAMLLLLFSGCELLQKTVSDVEPNPLLGTWSGEAWYDEIWVFNEDGTGRNENSLLSYDFEYSYLQGKLNVYQKFFGTVSDTAMVYEVTLNEDGTITLLDTEIDTAYILSK